MGLKLLLCAALLASGCLAQGDTDQEMKIWGKKLFAQLSSRDVEVLKAKLSEPDFEFGPRAVHFLPWLSSKGLLNEIPQPLADAMSLEDTSVRNKRVEILLTAALQAMQWVQFEQHQFQPAFRERMFPDELRQTLRPYIDRSQPADLVASTADQQMVHQQSLLGQDGLFDVTMNFLKQKKIPIVMPPGLRQTARIRDIKQRKQVIERLMEIAVTSMLGCPSQKVVKKHFPMDSDKIPMCEDGLLGRNGLPESQRVVLQRLNGLTEQLLRSEEQGERGVQTPARKVASTLFELTHGRRPWMNLGPQDRQRFFKEVARKVISQGTAPDPTDALVVETLKLACQQEPVLPSIRFACSKQDELTASMASRSDDLRLINGVGEELASAVQEGRLKTKDDAIALGQQLVQQFSQQEADLRG
ncbi:unnamed protein product, partial [Mesorhabditis spiculigera]